MEDAERQENHSVLSFLEALRKASKDLQTNPIFTTCDPQTTIENILKLQSEDEIVLASDPNLFRLSQMLRNLKTRAAFNVEAEIVAYIDRECIENLVKILQEVESEGKKLEVLKEFGKRLSRGFDGDFQELILRRKVFSVLEWLLCGSACSVRIREQAGLTIVALVRFNRDVFVGLVLMGPIVKSLISIASRRSIQVLCSLVKLIRIPLIDEMELNGEISRIISLLYSSQDLSVQVSALDCVNEIAYFARKEVIEAMLEEGLIEKLVEMQTCNHGANLIKMDRPDKEETAVVGEGSVRLDTRMDDEDAETVESWPFAGCISRFSVQIEVGEGLDPKEKTEIKEEILRRIRGATVSEADTANIFVEVLWGSSP